jgi:hypothetical protein
LSKAYGVAFACEVPTTTRKAMRPPLEIFARVIVVF